MIRRQRPHHWARTGPRARRRIGEPTGLQRCNPARSQRSAAPSSAGRVVRRRSRVRHAVPRRSGPVPPAASNGKLRQRVRTSSVVPNRAAASRCSSASRTDTSDRRARLRKMTANGPTAGALLGRCSDRRRGIGSLARSGRHQEVVQHECPRATSGGRPRARAARAQPARFGADIGRRSRNMLAMLSRTCASCWPQRVTQGRVATASPPRRVRGEQRDRPPRDERTTSRIVSRRQLQCPFSEIGRRPRIRRSQLLGAAARVAIATSSPGLVAAGELCCYLDRQCAAREQHVGAAAGSSCAAPRPARSYGPHRGPGRARTPAGRRSREDAGVDEFAETGESPDAEIAHRREIGDRDRRPSEEAATARVRDRRQAASRLCMSPLSGSASGPR